MNKYMVALEYRDNSKGNNFKVKYLYFTYQSGMGSVVNWSESLAIYYLENPINKKSIIFDNVRIMLDGNFQGILPNSMLKAGKLYEWVKDDNAVNAWGQLTGGKWNILERIIK